MRTKLLIFFSVITVFILYIVFIKPKRFVQKPKQFELVNAQLATQIIHNKAIAMEQFAKQNNYNSEIYFLINMAVPSRLPRFYIYNFKRKKIIDQGLVCHGRGSDESNQFIFKNTINSYASSKGMYKIANKYNGEFGLAYKLHGLNTTNNNAFARFVVLHSHACVPTTAVSSNICRSEGCPTVAPSFLTILAQYIDQSSKPILLDIDYLKE